MNTFNDLSFQENKLLDNLKTFPEKDRKTIIKAYRFASKYHSGQKRDEGSPYVIHVLRVTCLLIEELNVRDSDIICAAILHDTIEDTTLGLRKIIDNFGDKVGEIVKNLTRGKRGETEKNKYQRKYQKFLKAMKMDKTTRTIKVCDWLDNMMSWPYIPKTHPSRRKLKRWLQEVETMYIPLALTIDKRLADKMEIARGKLKSKFKKELN